MEKLKMFQVPFIWQCFCISIETNLSKDEFISFRKWDGIIMKTLVYSGMKEYKGINVTLRKVHLPCILWQEASWSVAAHLCFHQSLTSTVVFTEILSSGYLTGWLKYSWRLSLNIFLLQVSLFTLHLDIEISSLPHHLRSVGDYVKP